MLASARPNGCWPAGALDDPQCGPTLDDRRATIPLRTDRSLNMCLRQYGSINGNCLND